MLTHKFPRASVVIPAWNAASTVVRSVRSALAQKIALEVIVVNDGSTDATADVLEQAFAMEPRVRILCTGTSVGASAARNVGIRAAQAPFIAFLDADDLWLPGKIAAQLEIVECDDEVTLVTCNSLHVSPFGEVWLRSHRHGREPASGPDAWKLLLERNFIPTPTVLAHTADLLELDGFREDLRVGEDLDLWIRLARRGSVAVLPDVYVHWFAYSGSLMSRSGSEENAKVMDMVVGHLDDPRLNDADRSRVRTQRSLELGDHSLAYGDFDRAKTFYATAHEGGVPKLPLAWRVMKGRLRAKLDRRMLPKHKATTL